MVKMYKGFNKDMTCNGFQYQEGEIYHEDKAELCECGFHACENPLDCFRYYSPVSSVYCEVDLDDLTDEKGDDSKRCGKTIKIGAALDVAGLCRAHFEYVKKKCKPDQSNIKGDKEELAAQDYSSLAARNWSSLAARNWSSLAAQDWSSLAARNWSSLAAQDKSSLAAQDGSSLAARNWSSLAARNWSSLAARNWSSLAAQDYSSLAAQDGSKLSASKNSVIAAFNSIAKGGLGTLIAIANRDDEGNIIDWAAGIVDGEIIKADIWYKVKDGRFVEVEE